MTNEEAVKHLTNDWYISIVGQVCIDADVADSFLKAVGIGIKAINGQENPTAHIDLEAREPCSKCRSCASCLSSTESVKYYPCLQCERYENFSTRNFCPECGRPLTPEAWAMLEKRLRG